MEVLICVKMESSLGCIAGAINTTFAIESTEELTFEEVMTPEVIEKYNAKTRGEVNIEPE